MPATPSASGISRRRRSKQSALGLLTPWLRHGSGRRLLPRYLRDSDNWNWHLPGMPAHRVHGRRTAIELIARRHHP